ncbi:c-type cytochrome [Pseudofrankia sp. DC12]|uniref:cytochrome bc1 complex diheme cytochrome c subunit n=1 Tax=Pseudofrankia sp. DC12 TaxID=683315 RepID=UPI001E33CA4F|nr:c-type cytochrome [Pseudofrankia sp. DC12]
MTASHELTPPEGASAAADPGVVPELVDELSGPVETEATEPVDALVPELADADDELDADDEDDPVAERPVRVPGRLAPRTRRSRPVSVKRRRRSSALVLSLALLATGVLWSVLAPSGNAADPTESEAVRNGQALYLQGCSTCHGLNAAGTQSGPSLIGVGSAAVDFQMSTGRMPLAGAAAQAKRKDPSYSQTQIDQIAAYIQTMGGGLEKPTITQKELADADMAFGGELYRSNCAQCHQVAGQGAPLTYGKYAPALTNATPEQILEAMRVGPESMPVFGQGQLDDNSAKAIAAYIVASRDATSPGGDKLGAYGPVPEGLLAILVGIGGLLGVCLWIGARQKV